MMLLMIAKFIVLRLDFSAADVPGPCSASDCFYFRIFRHVNMFAHRPSLRNHEAPPSLVAWQRVRSRRHTRPYFRDP